MVLVKVNIRNLMTGLIGRLAQPGIYTFAANAIRIATGSNFYKNG